MGGKSAALAIPIRGAQTAELNLDTGSDVQAELAKYYVGTLLADSAEVTVWFKRAQVRYQEHWQFAPGGGS